MTFLDNDGAKAALVAGHSTNAVSAMLVNRVGDELAMLGGSTGYDRVPSTANPADAPSRGDAPPSVADWPKPGAVSSDQVLEACLKCNIAFGSQAKN